MQCNFTIYIQGPTKYYQHGVKDEARNSFIKKNYESELVL